MSDVVFIPHVLQTKTVFALRLRRDGSPVDLTGLTLRAGIESNKSTGTSSSSWRKFAVTGHGTHGTLSGTIPATGIAFTGPSTMRVWVSGAPRSFIGPPVVVMARTLSPNWISG